MLVGPLVRCSTGPLVRWSVGPLVRWSVGPLVRWSIGPLVRWSVGLLVRWSISWSVCPHDKIFRNLLTSKTGYVAIPSRLGFGDNLVFLWNDNFVFSMSTSRCTLPFYALWVDDPWKGRATGGLRPSSTPLDTSRRTPMIISVDRKIEPYAH
jgi:hypothetical protein